MPTQRQILRAFNVAYEKQIRIAERQSYKDAYKVYQDALKQATELFINGQSITQVNVLDAVAFTKLFEDIFSKQGVRFAKWYRALFRKIATKNNDPDLTIWQMEMMRYGREEAGKYVVTVQETMQAEFMAQIRREYQDPEFMSLGAEQQAARLRKRGYWNKKARMMALRVARTESNKAANLGIEQSSLSMFDKTELDKKWQTSRDEKVRSTHQAMEGVTIPFDGQFILPSGVTMRRPGVPTSGDSKAIASEVINCRCRAIDIPKPDLLDNLFDELTKPSQTATASGLIESTNDLVTTDFIRALFGRS